MKRRLIILLLALVAVFAPIARADSGGDNVAVSINQKDGSSVFDFAFAIRHVLTDTVDQGNAAVAYASCTDCQTTALAIEIVLVEGNPTTIAPTNLAIAENVACTLCDTFASAYQFVISTGGPVHFTEEGIAELHDIRAEIDSWGKQGLTNDQIRQLLPGVIGRLRTVLATQLVPDGNSGASPHFSESATESTAQPNAPPATTTTGETTDPATTAPQTTTTAPPTTTTPTTTTEPTTTTTTTTGGTTTGP